MKNAAPENQTETTPTPKKIRPWGSIGILFSAFAFIVLIAGFYLGYCKIIKNETRLANAVAGLDGTVNTRDTDIADLQKTLSDTQQNLQQLQTTVATQEQTLSNLHPASSSLDTWRVAEAQYLTTLANDNLQLGQNVPLVISLLQTADEKIRDLSDPNLTAVRKVLATDIAALQAVPKVDLTGIYLRLSALNTQVDKLPLPNKRPDADQVPEANTGKRVSWWKRGLRQSWEAIRQVVIIRYNKAGQPPFIPPDQQAFLYQNLHAMFEQALSAVVQRQPDIYRMSLTQASDWIKQYFLQDSPVTQAILSGLNELQNQALAPTLPNITASLQAFNDYFTPRTDAQKSAPTGTTQQ